ncbi:hypothetical protein [Streptomyces sp. NPDC058297]|uniref:hypothetical protein n=1 Tax=Streptomyces sp. NPDC058297 TaxID=3346433 RepID=UPI0036E4213E
MTPELLTVIVGAIGALAGAGGALGGTVVAKNQAREQIAAAQEEQRAAARRGAYVTFLACANVFQSACDELADQMKRWPESREHCERVHVRYMSEWNELVRSRAAVEVEGPAGVAAAARKLGGALGALSHACDSWYARLQSGGRNGTDLTALGSSVWDERLMFAEAARMELGGERLPEMLNAPSSGSTQSAV